MKKTLTTLLSESSSSTDTQFQAKLKQAKHTLNYYIDKYHPDLPTNCQICDSIQNTVKKIPNPNEPYQINILCQHCLNKIYNHTGDPLTDLPDTLNIKKLPKNTSLPSTAKIRRKLSAWRTKHPITMSSLSCQGCGVSNSTTKLYLKPPNLHEPYKVNAVCPTCNYDFNKNSNYPPPIDLHQYEEEATNKRFAQLASAKLTDKTHGIIKTLIQTYNLTPTKCSLCGEPLTSNYSILIDNPTDVQTFYTICKYCQDDDLTPSTHTELHDQIDQGIGLGGSAYRITDLISQKQKDFT